MGRDIEIMPDLGQLAATSRASLFAEKVAPAARDEEFEKTFLANYARLVTLLARITGDRSRAEDLAIESFWRLYRQRPSLRADGSGGQCSGGWLYRTATRLGIDSLRAETRRRRYEEKAAAVDRSRQTDPLSDALLSETQRQVRKTLARLPRRQAELLFLRASGFSYKELASILDVKHTSIGAMLLRAESAFRKRYVALFGEENL